MKKLILVIDDNQDTLDLLSDELTAEGYEVAIAADGLEAIRQLKRRRPDLLIIDIMMPKISGPRVMMLIAEQPHLQSFGDIPVVVLSARTNINFVRDEGLPIGEGDYLEKPIDFERLHALLRKKLQ